MYYCFLAKCSLNDNEPIPKPVLDKNDPELKV